MFMGILRSPQWKPLAEYQYDFPAAATGDPVGAKRRTAQQKRQ
jgi:hypothetical protein